MRIISKFHDYYDSVQNMGIDTTCIYVRELKEYTFIQKGVDWRDKNTVREARLGRGHSNTFYDCSTFLIGFCGSIFPGIRVTEMWSPYKKTTSDKFFYSKEELNSFRETLSKEKKNDIITGKFSYWNHRGDFFNDSWNNYKENFIHYKVPIFIVEQPYGQNELFLRLNANLKDHDFQKIKDPYTAYQEIYQYISGVLGTNSPKTIEIQDKDKIIKRGFDKWSFRKLPSKKTS